MLSWENEIQLNKNRISYYKDCDRKIATWKIVPQHILSWVRVWVSVRVGGNLPGGNVPSTAKTMRAFYLLLNIYLLFKLIFKDQIIYIIQMNKMCYVLVILFYI